jgi:hypothetical protein
MFSNVKKALKRACFVLQKSQESLIDTTNSYKDIVPSIFDCSVVPKAVVTAAASTAATTVTAAASTAAAAATTVAAADFATPTDAGGRMEAILARLVSDYRAIFAIEEQVEGGTYSR